MLKTSLAAALGLAALGTAPPTHADTQLRCEESGVVTYYSIGKTEARKINMNFPKPGETTIGTMRVVSETPTEFRLSPSSAAHPATVIHATGPEETTIIELLNPKTHEPAVTVINRLTGEIALEDGPPELASGICVPAQAKF
jgi:hypothetical protein